jgi:hypothetical protein
MGLRQMFAVHTKSTVLGLSFAALISPPLAEALGARIINGGGFSLPGRDIL